MQTFARVKQPTLRDVSAKGILDLVAPELALVEEEFERQANSNIQVIGYLGDYLRSSGGKRVRPALLVLSAHAVGGNGKEESVIRLATVMEMLHTATLVHDDIIDNAGTRRGRASVNARFGNQTAVLMGDWLYMSAYETSLKERSLELLEILTRLTRKMTEGELIQLTMIGRLDISIDEYFDILKRKTAYLFSACCEIGSILGGSTLPVQQALRDYGLNLGIAFQLTDDILDVVSEGEKIGKAAGADLIEGKLTLPLISLLSKEPGLTRDLENVMFDGNYSRFSRNDLLTKIKQHGVVEEIRHRAREFAQAAIKNLEVLPKTEYRLALEEIPNYVIGRSV